MRYRSVIDLCAVINQHFSIKSLELWTPLSVGPTLGPTIMGLKDCRMSTSSEVLLNPRAASEYIAQHSQDVKILQDGVKSIANKIVGLLKSREVVVDIGRWQINELNPKTQDEAAVNWVFLVDLLNFSFWSDTTHNQSKYAVQYKGHTWTGYWSLCAAFNRAVDEGICITDPHVYSTISREQFEHIVRSDTPGTCMPLIDERLASLHSAGATLCQKFGGSFVNVIRQCDNSAAKLLQLIVDNFPTFRDVAVYNGQHVALYKRAQILVGDVWACCGGKGFGLFNDIDVITAFADYRIPQALYWLGAFEYSPSLMESLKNKESLENGDRREVEIRGCTIWAVELIVQEIKRVIAEDTQLAGDKAPTINPIIIDHFLWDFRREHDAEVDSIPFHRTRCIYY